MAFNNKHEDKPPTVKTKLGSLKDAIYVAIAAVPMYIYVHLKYFFGATTTVNICMLKLLAVLLSPIGFLTIWTLKLARGVVYLWLACKERADLVQMVDGTDLVFIYKETSERRCVVTALLQLEFDGDREAFGQKVKEEIASVCSSKRFLKLQCSVVQSLGYYYFKRTHWPIDKHFTPLSNDSSNKPMTLESLREVISEIANAPMPCNDTALWEVRFGEKLLEGSGKSVYPFVFRFHHIVADAASLFDMFSGEFQNRFPPSDDKVGAKKQLRSLETIFTKKKIIAYPIMGPPVNNVLCQANGIKHVLWYTEEKPQILNAIKEMKLKLKNDVTFTDIILTCFLESLDNYFSKTCTGSEPDKSYPNSILTVVPIMPPNYNFKAYGTTNYTLANKMNAGLLRLPLKMDPNQCNLLKRLELVRQEYHVIKNESLDLMFNRWIATVLPVPSYVVNWALDKYSPSPALTVSNIPGCNSLKCFGGLNVKEFIVINANAPPSGVSLMITSYEERLSFAYTIDSAVIANVEDVKWISTNFMHNFNKLSYVVNA